MEKDNLTMEADKRMQILLKMGLEENVYEAWKLGEVCIAESTNMFGSRFGLNWLLNSIDYPDMYAIKEAVEEKGYKVFYSIYAEFERGRLFSLLVVSPCEEEWEDDREELENGEAYGFIYELDTMTSWYGFICFQMVGGGIIQTQ